jgi:hypothetical protein
LPPTRHLTRALAEATLHGGRGIEQLLAISIEPEGSRRVRWVSIWPGSHEQYTLRAHDVRYAGPLTWFDVTEFAPVDEEEFIGGGRLVGTYAEADLAISAAEALGAVSTRWVNEGLVGHEYQDAIN